MKELNIDTITDLLKYVKGFKGVHGHDHSDVGFGRSYYISFDKGSVRMSDHFNESYKVGTVYSAPKLSLGLTMEAIEEIKVWANKVSITNQWNYKINGEMVCEVEFSDGNRTITKWKDLYTK